MTLLLAVFRYGQVGRIIFSDVNVDRVIESLGTRFDAEESAIADRMIRDHSGSGTAGVVRRPTAVSIPIVRIIASPFVALALGLRNEDNQDVAARPLTYTSL